MLSYNKGRKIIEVGRIEERLWDKYYVWRYIF